MNEDASVLASGPVARTAYTLKIPVKASTITGVMLEALPHDSLPGYGPGRESSGNFVLSEFEVSHTVAENPENEIQSKLVDARGAKEQRRIAAQQAALGLPLCAWG